jgi:hypothetical protein
MLNCCRGAKEEVAKLKRGNIFNSSLNPLIDPSFPNMPLLLFVVGPDDGWTLMASAQI